ncbi:MAG: hypothetical protein AAF686_03225 [Pseudomonadota bacterium]
MKPDFALTLSFEGIGLLHRAPKGWDVVGEVALDAANLAAGLRQLRQSALALTTKGLQTKIVLPNDQIRFLRFDAAGVKEEQIADAVQQHLEGVTPYALKELAYDWSISAGEVFVAAVARETVAEAEAFAVEHGFEPLCFVAMPDPHDFLGEPWFGKTKHAEAALGNDLVLDRDTTAIRVNDAVASHASDLESVTAAVSSDTVPEQIQPMVEQQDDTPEADIKPPVTFVSRRGTAEEAEPQSATGDSLSPQVKAFVTSDILFPDTEMSDGEKPEIKRPSPEEIGAADGHDVERLDVEGVGLEKRFEEPNTPESAATTAPPVPDKQRVSAEWSGEDQFGKKTPFEAVKSASDHAAPPRALAAQSRGKRTEDEKQRMTIFGARDAAPLTAQPKYLGTIAAGLLVVALVGAAAWISVQGNSDAILEDAQIASPNTDAPAVSDTRPPDGPQENASTADATTADPITEPETNRLASLPVETQPDSEATPRTVEEGVISTPVAQDAAGLWSSTPEPPIVPPSGSLADFYQASIDPFVLSQDVVALPPATAYAPDAQPAPVPNPTAAGTRYDLDDRGLVRATPDGALSPDGVTVFAGRPALVPPERPAETLAEAEEPGTQQAVSELTAAQREALGSVRPNLRPEDLSEQNERAALGSGGRTQAELAALRPEARPPSAQELAEQAAAASTSGLTDALEDGDAALFVGATAQAVSSSSMPRARPEGFDRTVARALQAAQERARIAASRQASTVPTETAATQPDGAQTGNRQTASLLQPSIGREQSGRVAAAVPRNQRLNPNTRTATSVARAATEENVIRLRRINLIGVYGGPSDRRALVRLANGRYKKLQVGDRLDGGRVTAIGASEIRYSKGGRNLALKMPQG